MQRCRFACKLCVLKFRIQFNGNYFEWSDRSSSEARRTNRVLFLKYFEKWNVFSTCHRVNWLQSCAVWNFNLMIILFASLGNQRCLGWNLMFWFGWGAAGEVALLLAVLFRGPETFHCERSVIQTSHWELKTWVRCFTPFWVIQVEFATSSFD